MFLPRVLLIALLSIPLGFAQEQLTVSGVSAGGYFAQQFHVAHSSWVKGAGIVAAGPYACAKHGVMDAFYRCMEVTFGLPEASESLFEMKVQARLGGIDPLKHLADSKVYLLSGTRDATVSPQVVAALNQLYQSVGVSPVFERNLHVGHAFPTLNFGNSCREASRAPYISNCQRDTAGEILQTLLGPLKPRGRAKATQLFSFSQSQVGQVLSANRISMAQFGVAYVPQSCRPLGPKLCRVHVVFHGCRQTTDLIGDLYYTKTGYNEWAETNDLVVVYPQALRSTALGNPRGCWDWWGYTGPKFYTKGAPQIAVISKISRAFLRASAKLLPLKEAQPREE